MGGGLWGVVFTPIIMNGGIVFGGENSGWVRFFKLLLNKK
jgi:hypothetical protein